MSNFLLAPKCPYMGVQWKGNNQMEMVEFLCQLPAGLRSSEANALSLKQPQRTLQIDGYKVSGKHDTIWLNPMDWLVVAFSEVDGGFRLMSICVEEFEESFKVEAKPGPATDRFSTVGVKLQQGGNYD